MTRQVKAKVNHTPEGSLRTLYAGSVYELEDHVAYQSVEVTGQGEYHVDPDVAATEAAKREAAKEGVDLSKVEGSGAHGQATVEDVRKAKS